jgi:MraZ protein
MALFLGKYQYVIDEKGRVNIPAKFREQLARLSDLDLVIVKGLDGCLFVYPMSEVEKLEAKFESDEFDSEGLARLFQRLMADGGTTDRPDSQGRVTLNDEQRAHAGLGRDVVLFGNFSRIEIWEPERLKAHLAKPESMNLNLEDLAGRFFRRSSHKAGQEAKS